MKNCTLRKIAALLTILTVGLTLMLTGCTWNFGDFINPGDQLGGGGTVDEVPDTPDVSGVVDSVGSLDVSDSSVDTADTWDDSATFVEFTGSGATVQGAGAVFESGVLTVSAAGVYVLSGTLTDGRVYVNVDGNVQLVLNGVSIACSDSAPIAMFGKKKKVITLAAGTVNTLTDGAEYTVFLNADGDEPNGALFCKKALTINGSGSLTVNGNYNNGISCKDELKIMSGTISVNAANNGIKGNDAIIVKGGSLTVKADGDGLKSDSEDEGLGNIYLENAWLSVEAGDDGIQAYRYLHVTSGEYSIKTGRGSSWTGQDETMSYKAVKSDSAVVIEGGSFTLDSADDAIHSNGTIVISGGSLAISAADDAVHADEVLTIEGGTLDISSCYEGLEAAKVNISGGDITIISRDDAVNAADGTANPVGHANANCSLIISGGVLRISASGDGLDSNGTLLISGGEVYVDGPTSGADAALDSDGGILVNGGTLVAIGTLGMVETPAGNSAQNCISCATGTQIAAGTTLILRDASGSELISYTTAKGGQSVILSCAGLTIGQTYSLYAGSTLLKSFELTSTITTVGSNSGGPGVPGGNPGRPGGR